MKITKKDLVAGAVIATALGAMAGLVASGKVNKKLGKKIGKKVEKSALAVARDFYKYAGSEAKKVKKLSLADYEMLVKKAADGYKAQKLSQADKKALMREAKRAWLHAKKKMVKK